MQQYAKFWTGLLGAIAVSLLTVFAPDTTVGQVCTIVVAVAGAIGVYLVPNAPQGRTAFYGGPEGVGPGGGG